MRHARDARGLFSEGDTVHDYVRLALLIAAMYGCVLLMGAMKSWGWF